ncbi:UvrABC system protein C [bacterium HR12]|nr:UvrABC system protein C [bacterium HR12]
MIQPTLEEGIPLHEVTFLVIDLETTGGSPTDSRITEIGAVTYRGGERLGTFHTLVNPGVPIPPFITRLTGIDDLEVADAPPLAAVLPSLLEFARGAVFVAHNARFDFSFLNVALERHGYDPLPPPPVCTARLARRIVWPDVPNVRLTTLVDHFRTPTRPRHRALADAEACAEVLHALLEIGGRLGIRTLGDLHLAVAARGRPNFGKIRLADDLPHAPGVYLFKDREGRVLYVGKSKDLRSRVRSYFYGDARRMVGELLERTVAVEGIPCGSELEALVLEARLIREHEPRFNRRGRTWRRYAYLKLDLAETYPRLKVVRSPSGRGAFLGPFGSPRVARLAKEALEDAFPLRRCTRPMGAATRFPPCVLAEMGRCLAPCDGRVGPERYGELVRSLISSLTSPGGLLGALEARMRALAAEERFEEAADARDRLRALAEALERGRRDAWLLGARELAFRDATGREIRFPRGILEEVDARVPYPRERADEVAAVRSFLARRPLTLLAADPPLAEPVAGGADLHRALARLRAAAADQGPAAATRRAPNGR